MKTSNWNNALIKEKHFNNMLKLPSQESQPHSRTPIDKRLFNFPFKNVSFDVFTIRS